MNVYFAHNRKWYQAISQPYSVDDRTMFLAMDVSEHDVTEFAIDILLDDKRVTMDREQVNHNLYNGWYSS